jgi:peptidoglycan/LPS O-acetylase OafA/YrhL
MVLEAFVKGRDNNFNVLRMVAAFSILIFHSFSLPYQEAQKVFGFHIGDIDDFFVHIFFVTSGFLVTASLLHRQSLADFLWARALRIFPALFLCLSCQLFL